MSGRVRFGFKFGVGLGGDGLIKRKCTVRIGSDIRLMVAGIVSSQVQVESGIRLTFADIFFRSVRVNIDGFFGSSQDLHLYS